MNVHATPDTPRAWAEFRRLKQQLQHPSPRHFPRARKHPRQKFNEGLQDQISRENAWLRSLRTFLPGHEPDRNVL